MECDCIVIGAGVLGLSVAYHLSLAGKRVSVLERERTVGLHASGRNAGMFRQLYHHPQLTEWAHASLKEWPSALREKSFRTTGSLVIGREIPAHHTALFAQKKISAGTKSVTEDLPAVYCKSDGLINPDLYMRYLFSRVREEGVEIHFQTGETEIHRSENERWNVSSENGQFSAPWLVLATGAWVNNPLQSAFSSLCVKAQPFARHLFVTRGLPEELFEDIPCGFVWNEQHGWYGRKWTDSSWLTSICDTVPAEPNTFSLKNEARKEIEEQVVTSLESAFPDCARLLAVEDSWHCFRTYAEDQLPIFGEDPNAPGLFWLSCFGGYGMSTSFAATKTASEYILGRSAAKIPEFCPSRARIE